VPSQSEQGDPDEDGHDYSNDSGREEGGKEWETRLDHEDSHRVSAEAEKDHVAEGCISRESGNEIQPLGEHGIEKDTGQQPDPESRCNVGKNRTQKKGDEQKDFVCVVLQSYHAAFTLFPTKLCPANVTIPESF
jgi:hypothetical protein